MLCYFVIGILVANFAVSDAQLCYRCFGSDWCNNVAHPNFTSNVHTINCPASANTYNYESFSPSIARMLQSLEEVFNQTGDAAVLNTSTWGCVTATLHEAHEVHTVRTCLNNAAIICPTVRNVVLNPNVNDISPDMELDCGGCTGSLCNNHTFIEVEPEAATTTTTTTTSVIITTTIVSPTTISPSTQTSTTTSTTTSPLTVTTSTPSSEPIPPTEVTTEGQVETTTPDSSPSVIGSYVVLIVAIIVEFVMF